MTVVRIIGGYVCFICFLFIVVMVLCVMMCYCGGIECEYRGVFIDWMINIAGGDC